MKIPLPYKSVPMAPSHKIGAPFSRSSKAKPDMIREYLIPQPAPTCDEGSTGRFVIITVSANILDLCGAPGFATSSNLFIVPALSVGFLRLQGSKYRNSSQQDQGPRLTR